MRYEFSWLNGTELKTFATSCPQIAETMMRSSSDFPKRSPEIQRQFDAIYGAERGKFEKLMREAANNTEFGQVKTGIQDLTVHATEDSGVHLC